MYCWGNCSSGELGFGDVEDDLVTSPRSIPAYLGTSKVQTVASGERHSIFLFENGKVYSCGSNELWQLGRKNSAKEIELVEVLADHVITQISCGSNHSLALSKWGEIFIWGCNASSQPTDHSVHACNDTPRLVRSLATKKVVQIACGVDLCLVLLENGQLYSWGKNDHGQLGIGVISDYEANPVYVKSLEGVPIMHISCGGYHCFVITTLGAVYCWGRNSHGQLGLNDETDRALPSHLEALRSQRVRYVSCGENHTVILTQDGGVFTFGSGLYGQLGHGSTSNEIVPRKVLELMGSAIIQISCGSRHTLVYGPKQDTIFAFGQGGNGQLGFDSTVNVHKPTAVNAPWKSSDSNSSSKSDSTKSKPSVLKRLFCGGDHSFAVFTENNTPDDLRVRPTEGQILKLTMVLALDCKRVKEEHQAAQELLEYIEVVFGSSACINASFLPHGNDYEPCHSKNPGVDAEAVEDFFKKIVQIKKTSLVEAILESMRTDLVSSLTPDPLDSEALRVYLIIVKCHLFEDPIHYSTLCTAVGKAILALGPSATKELDSWWALLSCEDFYHLIDIYKTCVVHLLDGVSSQVENIFDERVSLAVALKILGRLNRLNRERETPLSYEMFYIPDITDKTDVRYDYVRWVSQGGDPNHLFLCDFPFIFDAKAKTRILQTDAILQMQMAMEEVHLRNFSSLFFPVDPANPYLVLIVSRENLVQDALKQLISFSARRNNLKKPLKVIFYGEDAVDGGGVRKEFFMLLMKDLIDPKYGMFKIYEETNCIWFNSKTFENEQMFHLIGLLCALAIYNGNIIDLPFPLALYKKLLSETVKLDDVRGLSPAFHRGFKDMLDYEGDDFEGTFGQYFEVPVEGFGEVETRELKPGGKDIVVTKDNCQEYVDLYVDFLFHTSVETQYRPFHAGFHKVLGGRVLELFHSQELMAMVIGNENYEWDVLEANAEYKDDYSKDHPTIKLLWEVFHDLELEQKKKFLLFLTGFDRIPIFGMTSLKITIQPAGGGEDYLPVAHTCFNLLDLPRYSTRETLKDKLLLAIDHTHGFGLA